MTIPDDVYAEVGNAVGGYEEGRVAYEAQVPQDDPEIEPLLQNVQTSFQKMTAANAPLLEGKLPDDLAAVMTRRAAEMTQMQGLGIGQMAGRLTLRDMGLVSLDMQQRGMQNQAAIAEGTQALAQVRNARREFNSAYFQQAEQLRDASRRTSLTALGMGFEQGQFKANLAMQVNAQILDLTKFRESLLLEYTKGVPYSESASNSGGSHSISGSQSLRDTFGDSASTLDNLIGQLSVIAGEQR